MNSFKYTLQKYTGIGSRYTCPSCNKNRKFTRYINNEDGQYLADHVGKCDREIECGYHLPPSQYFKQNPTSDFKSFNKIVTKRLMPMVQPTKTVSIIPSQYFQSSINSTSVETINFIQYLKTIVGIRWKDCVKRFNIGIANKWPGAIVFWQIDCLGQVRTGRIMQYNPQTGKRVKGRITWVHSELQKRKLIAPDSNISQCLFGEHQLIEHPNRSVVIVESEKTAVIASAYMPEFTWMACGGLNGVNSRTFDPLRKNKIILYPDIKGYQNWYKKANELRKNGFHITVTDLLEKGGFVSQQEREAGYDLADYLPRMPLPLCNLEKLISINPLIGELISRLDLVDPINIENFSVNI